MRGFRLIISGSSMVVSVTALVTTLATTLGCSFKPFEGIGLPDAAGGGTGGTPGMVIDSAVFTSDAPREYITSGNDTDGGGPTADANCGNQPFGVTALPPDLLIVLDRSGSMDQSVTGGNCGAGCVSKWTQVITAINQVVAMTETTINWGLKFFGTNNACGVTAGAAVPPGPNNAMAIAGAIALPANQPGSQTPTTAGELSAGAYLATLTDPNQKFILLATDGQPNCAAGGGGGGGGANDDAAAIMSVATVATMGFPTFVIGVATGGSTADTTLSAMAVNGGFPTSGTPRYYSVTTTADLVTALGTISTITSGMCTYPLGTPSAEADVTKTSVTVDGVQIPQDDPNGWHFDPGMTSITFTGSKCTDLMVGTARRVQVLYGCKIIPI
jgi:hypothetical protein